LLNQASDGFNHLVWVLSGRGHAPFSHHLPYFTNSASKDFCPTDVDPKAQQAATFLEMG
jgi:hypothetical protein